MHSRRHGAVLAGVLLLVLSLLVPPVAAGTSEARQEPARAEGEEDRARYILQLTDPPVASYRGGVNGLHPTNPESRGERRLDAQSRHSRAYRDHLEQRHAEVRERMERALERRVRVDHEYFYAFNGLTAELTERESRVVARLEGVQQVQRDFERHIHTDAGPAWIGAPSVWDGSATATLPATKGEGVVIGVIDTGVNHDHPSFADIGGDEHDHTNPRGRFFGVCDPVTGAPFCNDKLIGVHDFTATSPLDDHGHGSHTASTAGGNVVEDATLHAPTITVTRDIAGVAPHANLITYKACNAIGRCLGASLVAAIDQATADGVDVINYSIGGGSNDPWGDSDALAFLGARDAGVFVATSAGNSGPRPETVGSPADAPWVMSVGASTHNRKFINSLVNLSGGTDAPGDITGKSLTSDYPKGAGAAPVVHARDFGDAMCLRPFAPGTFDGEIVVCDRGVNPRVEKGRNVQVGGAGGYVLANTAAEGESTVADAHVLPAVHVGFLDGQRLRTWLESGIGHSARISGTSADEAAVNGDVMAGFSSRGPNPSVPTVLKPDVTAPGVDVLAAVHTTDPSAAPEFGLMSGTSMSSPHAAGAAALVRALRPEWSPAQAQSALMSTGVRDGVRKEDGVKSADAFDRGGGRIDLTRAVGAGLVLDEGILNFEQADPEPDEGEPGDPKTLNLASLANPDCGETCTWTRTVESTATTTTQWKVRVAAPKNLKISVSPNNFRLDPGATQTLTVTADASRLPLEHWGFGEIRLSPVSTAVPAQHLSVAVGVSTPTPVDIAAGDTRGESTATLEAGSDANRTVVRVSGLQEGQAETARVEQDPTPLDPYDAEPGTRSFLVDVPDGARLLTANTSNNAFERDVDLLVGRDDDGDGKPDAGEELCASTSPTANESCTLRAPAPGSYWVMVQTWFAGVSDGTTEWAAAVLPGTDNGNLSVEVPRSVSKGEEFDAVLRWNEPELEPGGAWFALVEVGSSKQRPADVAALLVDLRRS